jgi:hypothetical protein
LFVYPHYEQLFSFHFLCAIDASENNYLGSCIVEFRNLLFFCFVDWSIWWVRVLTVYRDLGMGLHWCNWALCLIQSTTNAHRFLRCEKLPTEYCCSLHPKMSYMTLRKWCFDGACYLKLLGCPFFFQSLWSAWL